MYCQRCGKDLHGMKRCNFCGYENSDGNVRSMTDNEKIFFDGITIEADSNNENFSNRSHNYNFRMRESYTNFNGSNIFTRLLISFVRSMLGGNRLTKRILKLILFGLIMLITFIAMPIFLLILMLGIMIFCISKILK